MNKYLVSEFKESVLSLKEISQYHKHKEMREFAGKFYKVIQLLVGNDKPERADLSQLKNLTEIGKKDVEILSEEADGFFRKKRLEDLPVKPDKPYKQEGLAEPLPEPSYHDPKSFNCVSDLDTCKAQKRRRSENNSVCYIAFSVCLLKQLISLANDLTVGYL